MRLVVEGGLPAYRKRRLWGSVNARLSCLVCGGASRLQFLFMIGLKWTLLLFHSQILIRFAM